VFPVGSWGFLLIVRSCFTDGLDDLQLHSSAFMSLWPGHSGDKNNENIGVQQATLVNVYGLIGWVFGLVIFGTSFEWLRRRHYSFFKFVHFSFLLFYGFRAAHNFEMAMYTIAAAVLYLLDKFIRVVWGWLPKKTVLLRYKEGDIIQLVFPKHWLAKTLHMHQVGQYVFVNFPTLGLFEWHPFSVSSGPEERTVEIHIKALGDHTRKLVDVAKGKENMWIRVDGPYGNHRINYRRFHSLVLVSGGIGVTPIIGFIKDIYRYGDREPEAVPKPSNLQKVYVIWTVSSLEQYNWFAQELKACLQNSKTLSDVPPLDLRVHITRDTGGVNEPFFYNGRPDLDALFTEVANTFQEKASTIFCCGPRAMVNEVWDNSVNKQRHGHHFHFHHETFEF